MLVAGHETAFSAPALVPFRRGAVAAGSCQRTVTAARVLIRAGPAMTNHMAVSAGGVGQEGGAVVTVHLGSSRLDQPE